jgi:transcriptional regulator of NAD metabolism
MNSETRRKTIGELLRSSDNPVKGGELAERMGVTRQVIVKDIAILRAGGERIISTPVGYLMQKDQMHYYKKVLAVVHNSDEIEDELNIIVKYGGIIEDVIVEHEIYGEIRGMMMLKTLYDVQRFIEKIKSSKSEPLMALTGGIHLHTVMAESREILDKIEDELRTRKYLAT